MWTYQAWAGLGAARPADEVRPSGFHRERKDVRSHHVGFLAKKHRSLRRDHSPRQASSRLGFFIFRENQLELAIVPSRRAERFLKGDL